MKKEDKELKKIVITETNKIIVLVNNIVTSGDPNFTIFRLALLSKIVNQLVKLNVTKEESMLFNDAQNIINFDKRGKRIHCFHLKKENDKRI